MSYLRFGFFFFFFFFVLSPPPVLTACVILIAAKFLNFNLTINLNGALCLPVETRISERNAEDEASPDMKMFISWGGKSTI